MHAAELLNDDPNSQKNADERSGSSKLVFEGLALVSEVVDTRQTLEIKVLSNYL